MGYTTAEQRILGEGTKSRVLKGHVPDRPGQVGPLDKHNDGCIYIRVDRYLNLYIWEGSMSLLDCMVYLLVLFRLHETVISISSDAVINQSVLDIDNI